MARVPDGYRGSRARAFRRSAIRLRTVRFTGGNSISPARWSISSSPRHTMSRNAPLACFHCQASQSCARQLPAAQLRMISDQLPDEEDLFAGDVPAPIAMCSHLIRSMPETVSERK